MMELLDTFFASFSMTWWLLGLMTGYWAAGDCDCK